MAITNAMIIQQAQFDLMREGKIGTTGRMIRVQLADGSEQLIQEPEPIHTYQHWKESGYQVRKGEKAVADFSVWKYTSKAKGETEEEAQEKGYCIMKKAFWFTMKQVDKIA